MPSNEWIYETFHRAVARRFKCLQPASRSARRIARAQPLGTDTFAAQLTGVFEAHLAGVKFEMIDKPNAWVACGLLGQCSLRRSMGPEQVEGVQERARIIQLATLRRLIRLKSAGGSRPP
jgi:hypothetical protein